MIYKFSELASRLHAQWKDQFKNQIASSKEVSQ